MLLQFVMRWREGSANEEGEITNGICSHLCRTENGNGLGDFDLKSFFFFSDAII